MFSLVVKTNHYIFYHFFSDPIKRYLIYRQEYATKIGEILINENF